MYKKINKEDIKYFTDLLGKVNVVHEISESYNRDEMPIYGDGNGELVLFVKTSLEISEIMKYAFEHNIPVTTRGSGSGLVGGAVPHDGGIILITSRMNQILEINTDNFSATLEPGVLLMDINAHLEKYNLYYPPDPGEKSASIGGNVSTNAGGMRAIKYGVTRNYIKALEVVLSNGEIIQLGKDTTKNSTGYDLKDLIIGSEGTLAIITKIVIKLIRKPKLFKSLLIPFSSVQDALHVVPEILKLPDLCTTLEFMEKEVVDDAKEFLGKVIPNNNYASYLIVSYDGDEEEVIHKAMKNCSDCVMSHKALEVFMSDSEDRQSTLWNARGAFLEGIKMSTTLMDECDVVLPITELASYLEFIKKLSEDLKVRIRSFGHAGDGNVHIYVCKDDLSDEKWAITVQSAMDQLYAEADRRGGILSGEHGVGYAKRDYHIQYTQQTTITLQRMIKGIFDPKNLLNPGKIF